jgi:hypothetical protein
MPTLIAFRSLVSGDFHGECAHVVPFSFWGGFDVASGTIIEPSHPSFGQCLTGKIMVTTSGRGSSSSSSVLAEAIRLKTAPRAIVIREIDSILATGSLVAREMYDLVCPVVQIAGHDWDKINLAKQIQVHGDTLEWTN